MIGQYSQISRYREPENRGRKKDLWRKSIKCCQITLYGRISYLSFENLGRRKGAVIVISFEIVEANHVVNGITRHLRLQGSFG